MHRYLSLFAALAIAATANVAFAQAQPTAEQVLSQNAQQGRYTFLVFYKQKDPATQAMVEAVEQGVAARSDEATLAFSKLSIPAEKPLVEKYGVSRAPMPLCIAIAPNGAITSMFRKPPQAADMTKAFATPTMTLCMKAMQDGKIVLVSVKASPQVKSAPLVASFQADSQFKNRIAVVSLNPADPAETDFINELELDADNTAAVATVLLAPPGVLVGKYPADATLAAVAADLHAAGKCCDDPNCKHHKATTTQKAPVTRRVTR